MILDMGRPHSLTPHDVHGVNVAASVAEIGQPAAFIRSNGDRRTHWRSCIEFPVGTAGVCVERINFSALAADEYPAAHYGRLCERKVCAGKSEGPFQLEGGHVLPRRGGHLPRVEGARAA